MSLSSSRRRTLIASAVALGVVAGLSYRLLLEPERSVTTSTTASPADSGGALPREQERLNVMPSAQPQTGVSAEATARPARQATASEGRAPDPAIDVVATAPAQVRHGNIFAVSIGLPHGLPVQSGNLLIAYDRDLLELVEIVDATGATLPDVSWADRGVEIEFDAAQGALHASAVKFIARTDSPRYVQISLAADLRDGAGSPLAVRSVAPSPVLVLP